MITLNVENEQFDNLRRDQVVICYNQYIISSQNLISISEGINISLND